MRLPFPLPASFAVLLIAGAVAACGGDAGELYRLEPTRECLREADIRLKTGDVDVVASTALGGALHADLEGNEVTAAFGESLEDAAQIERAYRRFAGRGFDIDSVLRRDRNVVMLWGVSPSEDHEATVTGCLET